MSLSPLYAAPSKDLHVTRPAGLHQPFGWLRHGHVKITTFRVYIALLGAPPPVNGTGPSRLNASAFAACLRITDTLAVQRNSLIRVTRRLSGARPRVVGPAPQSFRMLVSRLLSSPRGPTFHRSLTLLGTLSDLGMYSALDGRYHPHSHYTLKQCYWRRAGQGYRGVTVCASPFQAKAPAPASPQLVFGPGSSLFARRYWGNLG